MTTTGAFSPTVTDGDLRWFTLDSTTGKTSRELANTLQPFGVRTRKLTDDSVYAFRSDTGKICMAIGYLYRFDDAGVVFAVSLSGTTERQDKALVAAAGRAAVEPDFLRGGWSRKRATKRRGRLSIIQLCDVKPDDELSAALAAQLELPTAAAHSHAGPDIERFVAPKHATQIATEVTL